MKRREFLTAASGAGAATAATAAATRPAAAQEEDGEDGGDEQPDWGGWLDGVDGGYQDARGESEVTVTVGAEGNDGTNAFDPAGLWVDPGTTVRWEWSGNGDHNVNAQEGPASFQTDIIGDAGVHFEFEFTEAEAGITKYQCDPHVNLGMLGAVAVGEDVPTVSTGGGESGPVGVEEMGIPFHPHFVGIGALLMVVVSLVFTFFALKYGTSPHAKGGND